MNCGQLESHIDEFVDGELPPDAEAALRAHADGCAECGRSVRAAVELRARIAELPDAVAPQRDLWPEIAARIATRHGVVRPRTWPRFAAIAAGATVVAVAALVALQTEPPAPTPAIASTGTVVVTVDPGLQLAAQSMLDAAEDHGATDMSPATIAIVRENLELIDHALREIALALEMDPDNPQLQRQLLHTYRGQAELLEYIGRIGVQPTTRTDL